MKRLIVALLALCMVWPITAYAQGKWTREETRESTGTGGTVSRLEEAPIHPTWQMEPPSDTTWPDEVIADSFSYPQDPEMEALMLVWMADNQSWDMPVRGSRDGNLYTLTYDGRNGAIGIFDLAARRQFHLSDVFYDGFNYIAYINEYIALHMDDALADFAYEYGESHRVLTVGDTELPVNWGEIQEALLMRPFGGYPRDYDRFELRNGKLILFPASDDPYFSINLNGYGSPYLTIPLTPDISPFGQRHITVRYIRETIGVHSAVLPQVEVIGNDTLMPAVTKINAQMAVLYADVVEKTRERDAVLVAEGIVKRHYMNALYQPECFVSGKLVSVCFADGFGEGGFYVNRGTPVVRGQIYSLETGEPVSLSGIWDGPDPTDVWMLRYNETPLAIRTADGTVTYLEMPEAWQEGDTSAR